MASTNEQVQQAVNDFLKLYPDASEVELDQVVAGVLSGEGQIKQESPQTVSTITGMTPSEAQARGEAGLSALKAGATETALATPPALMRYGAPLVAGAATSGMSLVPQALSMAGAYGLSEGGAQALENLLSGEQYRPERIASSSVLGAAQPLTLAQTNQMIGKSLDNIKFGQGVVNFLANAGLQTAASETARYFEGEKSILDSFLPANQAAPEGITGTLIRFGVPIATSAVGSKIAYTQGLTEQAADRFAKLTAERFGAPVMVSELAEGFTNAEKKAISNGIPWLKSRLYDLSQNIGETITSHFSGAPNTEDLAKRLLATGASGKLEQLQSQANAAKSASDAAETAYAEAKRLNAINAPELEEQARIAGGKAVQQHAMYIDAVDNMFGIPRGDILASPERLKAIVADTAETARQAVRSGLGSLYSAAGIKEADTVLNKDMMMTYLIRRIKGPASRQEIISSIESAAARNPALIDEAGNISRDAFLKIRDEMVSSLTQAGKDPKNANRIAAEGYRAIVDASNAYMRQTNPRKLELLRNANKSNRAVEKVLGGLSSDWERESVIPMLQRGAIDDVVSLIEKEGAGPALKEIDSYAAALRGMGDPASKAASKVFVAKTMTAIRDHLVESSLLGTGIGGIDQTARLVDPKLLGQRLDSLRRYGFPTDRLRLGTQDEIKALARLSEDVGATMTVAKVNEFLNDAATLGSTAAEARVRYQKAYQDFLTSPSNKERDRQLALMKDAARTGKIKYEDSERLLAQARQDPLVKLFNTTDLNLSPDPSKNSQYTWALLDAGENNVKRLMDSLAGVGAERAGLSDAEKIRRLKLAEDLKKSAARDVFFNAIEAASMPGEKNINLTQINNLFTGSSEAAVRQRKSLIALLGKETFDEYKKKFAEPVKTILETADRLGEKVYDFRPEMTVAASALSAGAGAGAGGAGRIGAQRGVILRGWFNDISKFINNLEINTAYLLYVDPTFSKMYREAAYDLNKFVNASPRNLVAYRLAQESDNKLKQGKSNSNQPTR